MEMSLRDKIRIVAAGALHGQLGVITGRDEVCGWYFVALDRHVDDPAYRSVRYGPFTTDELERVTSAYVRRGAGQSIEHTATEVK